ncbi:unnamed protein product [Phaedon cochleariae]|uniref:Uncharacterized protein n=1 Tax=Phaedon cochleariae TaxID=80249 RepID=A0A9N9SHG1_PHACE|nr:unnamed protein product [Phaedon cochleariae]
MTEQSQALQDCPRIVQQSRQTLQNSMVSQKRWPINDKMAMDLHFAIGEMIAVDNQPYSVVENIGFRRMLAKAQPKSEDEDIQDIQAQIEETVSTFSTVDENSKSVHETEGSDSDQDEIPLSLLLPSPQKKLKSNLNKSVWDSFSDMVAASSASTSGQTKN